MMPLLRAGALLVPPLHPQLAQLARDVAPLTLDDVAPVVRDPRRVRDGWRACPRHSITGREGLTAQDGTVAPYAPVLRGSIRLRPYQQAAVQAWRQARADGCIEAPCGAGKTEMGAACIAATPTPALVLVHSGDLLEQWVARISSRLGVQPVVAESPDASGRVVVATFQRLARWSRAQRATFGARFGLVVIDEAHHVPARSWGEVLADLPARLRLALTATPDRLDGLRPLLHLHCGPLVHRVEITVLQALGATLVPLVHRVDTGWRAPKGDAGQARAKSRARNACIVDLVQRAAATGHRCLVLVQRVEHAERLARGMKKAGVPSAALVGTVATDDRQVVLAQLRAGILRCVVATQLADEGLDVPELTCVVLANYTASEGRTRQRIGRILRPSPSKGRPIVYDLVDAGPKAREAWSERAAMYRELGWEVAK